MTTRLAAPTPTRTMLAWGVLAALASISSIAVGENVNCSSSMISAGWDFTCEINNRSAELRCWGHGSKGALGQGTLSSIGVPAEQLRNVTVDLGSGRRVVSVSAGENHACAILSTLELKCWGANNYGQLGLGNTNNWGDDPGEMGDALAAVSLGTGRGAVAVSTGGWHTCAILSTGELKCWGRNHRGQIGVGDTNPRGDGPGEMGDALPSVDLGTGRTALAVAAGHWHTCTLLDNREVKCWGAGGLLGISDSLDRGDEGGQMGSALPPLNFGFDPDDLRLTTASISLGALHTCAVQSQLLPTLPCSPQVTAFLQQQLTRAPTCPF